jgi:hypothetical protein
MMQERAKYMNRLRRVLEVDQMEQMRFGCVNQDEASGTTAQTAVAHGLLSYFAVEGL